jgi:hypothetical protein
LVVLSVDVFSLTASARMDLRTTRAPERFAEARRMEAVARACAGATVKDAVMADMVV